MEFLTITLGLIFSLAFLQTLAAFRRRTKNFPPGPTPLPIIGNLHLLGDQPHKSLSKLAAKHGPIMSMKLGRITTVVISSPAMAKEVLQKQDLAFCSRKAPDAACFIDHHKYSVLWIPTGPKWRSLRKILNSYIFTNNKIDANQHLRLRKVKDLISFCDKNSKQGAAVEIGHATLTTSLNLLSNTLFSADVTERNSDSTETFKDLIRVIMVETGKPNMVDFFPALSKLDPQGVRRRISIPVIKLLKIVDGIINERLKERELEGAVKNDLLDVLLSTSEENPEEIDRNDIVHLCLDLFVAGTDSTSVTVEWAMSEIIRNPEIMEKAKRELAQVIGKGKIIEEDDIVRLPYLRCIVKETLRMHPPGPFLLPRKVEQEVQVCGYTVPKGSQVLVNAFAIGRDSGVWESPSVFKPERFWESEIDIRGQNFELIPFGAGRRICPGVPLATRMVHLMLGSLINSFNWELEGQVLPERLDMNDNFGLTLNKAQPLRAIPIPI